MEISTLLFHLLLGGLLGAIGQSIRVIVGLKKLYEDSQQNSKSFNDSFQTKQLMLSLLIGFIAGVLGMVAMLEFDGAGTPVVINKALIVQLLAVGYAGTDFIEGFVKKYLPQNSASDPYKTTHPTPIDVPPAPQRGKIPQS